MAETRQYPVTYTVAAGNRVSAIMAAAAMLRAGVRFVTLGAVQPLYLGWWAVTFTVEETIGADDPPEPVWELPESADPITAAKGDLQRWGA